MELLIDRLTESPVIPSSQTIDLVGEPCMWVMGAPRTDDTRERKPPRFPGLMDVGLAPFVLLGRDGVEWAVEISDEVAIALSIIGDASEGYPHGAATDWYRVEAGPDATRSFEVTAAGHTDGPVWLLRADAAVHTVRIDSAGPDVRTTYLPHLLEYDGPPTPASLEIAPETQLATLIVKGKPRRLERLRQENARRLAALLTLADRPDIGVDGGATTIEDWATIEVQSAPAGWRRLVVHHRDRHYLVEVDRAGALTLVRAALAVGGGLPFSLPGIELPEGG